jgi:predicted alpha/beta hydrolase family esterase
MTIEHAQIMVQKFPTRFVLVLHNGHYFTEIKFNTLEELKGGINELYENTYPNRPKEQTA